MKWLILVVTGVGWTQNLFPENVFAPKIEIGSKLYSDQHFSYSGGLELNIPFNRSLSLRPRIGGSFFTNKYSRKEINTLDYGLELAVSQTKGFPVSLSALATREHLYSEREWEDNLNISVYHEIFGFVRVGLDKYFPIGRHLRIIPEVSSWLMFSKDELDRVTGISLSASHTGGPFFKLGYYNIGTESRDDLQHSFEVSVGVVILKEEE